MRCLIIKCVKPYCDLITSQKKCLKRKNAAELFYCLFLLQLFLLHISNNSVRANADKMIDAPVNRLHI